MSEARVPLLDLADAAAVGESARIPPDFRHLNVFRALLHRPALAKAISDLLGANFGSTLDARLRELVIMRTGWVTGADYEWTQHWSVALEHYGCSEQDLLACRQGPEDPHFGETERAVLHATDETLADGALSAGTFERCAKALGGPEAAVDLVTAIGCWRFISQILRSLDIPLEDGVASWPPDGGAPTRTHG